MTCSGCKVYGNVPHRCKRGDCDCVGCKRGEERRERPKIIEIRRASVSRNDRKR